MKKIKYIIIFIVCMITASNSIKAWSNYSVGDEVRYNNVDYYVLGDEGTTSSSVTLIKATPITSSEISSYLSSTEIENKVDTTGTYARMAYYAAEDCISSGDVSGCTTDYEVSNIKQMIDIWATHYTNSSDLVTDSKGYKARLIQYDELSDVVELEIIQTPSEPYYRIPSSANWLYKHDYYHWTMSQGNDSTTVWYVVGDGLLSSTSVSNPSGSVRPVITLSKSALGDINEENISDNSTLDEKTQVSVPNTLQKTSILFIMIGIILISLGILLALRNSDKFKNRK